MLGEHLQLLIKVMRQNIKQCMVSRAIL